MYNRNPQEFHRKIITNKVCLCIHPSTVCGGVVKEHYCFDAFYGF